MGDLTPYLCVADARAAIDWYQRALGASVTFEPIEMPDGRIGHCELAIGSAGWMLSDVFAEAGVGAPGPDAPATVSLHLVVDDCDAVTERAVALGARLDRGPEDSEPAGRVAVVRDPFGHRWFLNQETP